MLWSERALNKEGLAMQRVRLPGTALETSRFIFGTASLFNVGDQARRVRLLEAAVESGFTHFDTAPYYGFGMSERDLSGVLARHRHVTVTTKVGIYSPGGECQGRAAVFLRKAIGRALPRMSRPTIDWSVERARKMLDASLQRLGRDFIDLYLLHEPERGEVDEDVWSRWLEDEVVHGRVGQFGIALDEHQVAPFLASPSPLLRFVQTVDSLEGREADQLLEIGIPLGITYGYVSDALRRNRTVNVPNILEAALHRNPNGAVIVSTRNEGRLKTFSEIAALNNL